MSLDEHNRQPIDDNVLFDSKCDINSVESNSSVSDSNNNGNNLNNDQSMSKRQLKREKRNELWLKDREQRRKKEKEKKKLKLLELRANGVVINRRQLKSSLVSMKQSKCHLSVVIDCDFHSFMTDSETKKLVKQIGRCYAVNKHSLNPCQLYLTSVANGMRDQFSRSQSGFVNWDVNCLTTHWSQVFDDKTKIIYLTSDSDNILDDSVVCNESDYVLIIGGLVDHNRHKGLCHKLSLDYSVGHARLAIDEYIQMTQRRVLTVNHVFEIILGKCLGDSWQQVFQTVIPQRKINK